MMVGSRFRFAKDLALFAVAGVALTISPQRALANECDEGAWAQFYETYGGCMDIDCLAMADDTLYEQLCNCDGYCPDWGPELAELGV